MANHYRDQIAGLRNALSDEVAHSQTSELIRKLVEKVVVTLHAHLAGILSLATKAKRPLNESGPELAHIKLVAGGGFEPPTFRL
jgi:hypothetical protein